MGFLPTSKNQVDKNASETAAGVGLGDGVGVGLGDGAGLGEGEGIGVGVGVGRILLETEPQPISNHKLTANRKILVLGSIKIPLNPEIHGSVYK